MADDKKEEIIPVGPGAEEEIHGEEDEREVSSKAERAEASDEDGDERIGHDDTDEADGDRESIRARRRKEKEHRKDRLKRDRLELNFLRQRNESLERRQSEVEARQHQGENLSIDQRIGTIDDQIRQAEEVYALAITKQDGASSAEALRIRDDLRDGKRQLLSLKEQRKQTQTQQPNTPDPAIVERANEWMSENTWFDPKLRDESSMIARTIEHALYNEGRLDARSDEYWEEYERRLKKRLPEKFSSREEDESEDDEQDEPKEDRRPKGPKITTGGRERPLKKNEVYISADRKQAMIDANVWEDPKLRSKYLEQYSKYDREHGRKRY